MEGRQSFASVGALWLFAFKRCALGWPPWRRLPCTKAVRDAQIIERRLPINSIPHSRLKKRLPKETITKSEVIVQQLLVVVKYFSSLFTNAASVSLSIDSTANPL